jgi:hypothetical protein
LTGTELGVNSQTNGGCEKPLVSSSFQRRVLGDVERRSRSTKQACTWPGFRVGFVPIVE